MLNRVGGLLRLAEIDISLRMIDQQIEIVLLVGGIAAIGQAELRFDQLLCLFIGLEGLLHFAEAFATRAELLGIGLLPMGVPGLLILFHRRRGIFVGFAQRRIAILVPIIPSIAPILGIDS